MNKEISLRKILPVMFGFFIMGFVDIVGVSTSYVKNDFAGMNDTMVNLISLSCFLWFFLLSIPTGMLMNRIGRKKTVLLSFALLVAGDDRPAHRLRLHGRADRLRPDRHRQHTAAGVAQPAGDQRHRRGQTHRDADSRTVREGRQLVPRPDHRGPP